MKTFYAIVLTLIFAVAGCSGDKVNLSALKPAASKSAGKLTIVLLNKSGDLMQGQNEFVVQFKDDQGQPADVGDVQIGSSMSMPSMAPMSGDAALTPTGQTGIYKVTSNFAMSGAWHFTVSWNGPYGQGLAPTGALRTPGTSDGSRGEQGRSHAAGRGGSRAPAHRRSSDALRSSSCCHTRFDVCRPTSPGESRFPSIDGGSCTRRSGSCARCG